MLPTKPYLDLELRSSPLSNTMTRSSGLNHYKVNIYVVVQFYPWFKFYFPLYLGMVIYDNEFETMKNKI